MHCDTLWPDQHIWSPISIGLCCAHCDLNELCVCLAETWLQILGLEKKKWYETYPSPGILPSQAIQIIFLLWGKKLKQKLRNKQKTNKKSLWPMFAHTSFVELYLVGLCTLRVRNLPGYTPLIQLHSFVFWLNILILWVLSNILFLIGLCMCG